MTRVHIGIIGGGGIVQGRHIPGFKPLQNIEIVGICNRSRESSELFAGEFAVPNVFDDWRELVNSDEVDAVLIGTWPYMHCPITLAALEAGKHVFCQARMAMNAAEAAAMRDAARQSSLATMVCPAPTEIPYDRLMRKLLRERYVGDIFAIHVRVLNNQWLDPSKELHWRLKPELCGVNTLMVGLYIEWIHRWFGPIARVGSTIATRVPERRDPNTGEMRNVEYPDTVLMHGEMETGALIACEFSGVHSGTKQDVIEVYGSRGMLRYNVGENLIGARDGQEPEVIPVPDDLVRPWTVEADWVDAIRDPSQPLSKDVCNPSFKDGVRYMDATEAIYHSSESARAIDLPLSDELRLNTPAIGRRND